MIETDTPPAADLDQLVAWDRAHLWHPFTAITDWEANDPVVIAEANGVHLRDEKGRWLLDGVGSLWCNVHGHRHPALDAAIADQLGKVAHSTLLGASHRPAIELARRLAELAPGDLSRVFFSDDGATAVEVALKMAFQYWRQKPDPEPKRSRYIALGYAYHGDTLGVVSVGGVERFHAMFGPLLFPTERIPSPYCYRCPIGLERPGCGIACLGALEKALAAHPGEVAAVIVEPIVQGAAGMIVHPEGFLRGVRDLTRRYGTLLIADEVAVGFGKTGTLFACEQEGVVPDFLCLAKSLTGGYLPLAATLTNDRIYDAFRGTAADGRTFFHGHTFAGNPLGAAVALATLRVFDDEQTLDHLPAKAARLAEELDRLRRLAPVGDIRQRGLIAGVELVTDRATREPFPWERQVGARVCRRARDLGVLLRPLGDVLVLMPPLAITPDEITTLVRALDAAIVAELGLEP